MFYIPFNLIQFFNSKSSKHTGVFKHCTSQRIYLYLTHFNSGRIHITEVGKLVEFFGTSKQNVIKSLNKLVEWGFAVQENGYYRMNGIDTVTQILHTNGYELTSTYLYKFTKEDLQDSKIFKLLIFKYIGQDVAIRKGKKFTSITKKVLNQDTGEYNQVVNNSRIKYRKGRGYFAVDNDADNGDNDSSVITSSSEQKDSLHQPIYYMDTVMNYSYSEIKNPIINTVQQRQSLSYLGKANERSSRTIVRKLGQAEKAGLVSVKSFDSVRLSTIVDAHLLPNATNFVMLESERRSEGYEMRDTVMSKFPILCGKDCPVIYNSKDDMYRVIRKPANQVSYLGVESTCKINRKLWVKEPKPKTVVNSTGLIATSTLSGCNDLPY